MNINIQQLLMDKIKNGDLIIVDVGCGTVKRGNIGIDKFPFDNVDIVCDITEGIPLPDNCVDKIICFHVLEHLSNEKLFFVLEEFYRILKPSGILHIKVPHFSCGSIVWSDPTHIRPFSVRTFKEYFSSQKKMHYNYAVKFNYKCTKVELRFFSFSEDRKKKTKFEFIWKIIEKVVNVNDYTQILFERRFCYLFGGFEEIDVILECVK